MAVRSRGELCYRLCGYADAEHGLEPIRNGVLYQSAHCTDKRRSRRTGNDYDACSSSNFVIANQPPTEDVRVFGW